MFAFGLCAFLFIETQVLNDGKVLSAVNCSGTLRMELRLHQNGSDWTKRLSPVSQNIPSVTVFVGKQIVSYSTDDLTQVLVIHDKNIGVFEDITTIRSCFNGKVFVVGKLWGATAYTDFVVGVSDRSIRMKGQLFP